LAPYQLRLKVDHTGRRLVPGPVDRAHLREPAQRLDEVVAVEALPGRRDELDERLARVAPLADDEVAQVADLFRLVVGVEPLLARPLANRVAEGVAEIRCQPALLDLEHLVPAPGLVEVE